MVCVDGSLPYRNLGDTQNEIHHKPHLRAAIEEDGTSEDRVFGVTSLKEIGGTGAHIIASAANNFVSNAKLKMMQQSANRMFTRFHVGKVESNLFDSAQFKSWATSVSNIYKSTEKGNAAMVVTLTNRYGDETLASMLTAAKEIPDTKDVASSMLKAQIDSWVVQKTPADEVFKILKLDKAGYKLFASPSWTRWMTYAENRGNTNPYELLLSILIKRFSDDKIATMLARSKTELDTKIASDALENALHQKWMSVGKSEDDVFKLLKLHQEGTTKLLKNPVLSTWISYVSKKEMLDPYEELLFKLAKQYDDETLLEFIFASKEVTSTSTIAKNLEDALPKYWLGKRKLPMTYLRY